MSASNALHLISEINTALVDTSLLSFMVSFWLLEGTSALSSVGLSEISTQLQGPSTISRVLNLVSYLELP